MQSSVNDGSFTPYFGGRLLADTLPVCRHYNHLAWLIIVRKKERWKIFANFVALKRMHQDR